VLLGTALGDALGLPLEGLDPDTIARRFPSAATRFHLFGRTGFVSDDTEQTALVAEALVLGARDPQRTTQIFRRRLVTWFLRLPFGVGWATLKACLRLLFRMKASGSRSAGNGAAMRSAIVGAWLADDTELRRHMVRQLASITHADPLGVEGAVFVAELAAACVSSTGDAVRAELVDRASHAIINDAVRAAIDQAVQLAREHAGLRNVIRELGNSGYVVHSVGLATHCFLVGDTPIDAIDMALRSGGDTDSIGAIVGAWSGALHGENALPPDLIANLNDGPFGPTHLRGLAAALVGGTRPPRWSSLHAFARNLALFPVVLGHGLLRLAPPARWARHAVGLTALSGLLSIPISMIAMPGASHVGMPHSATRTQRETAARLQTDVKALSDGIGERRIGYVDSLTQAEKHLSAEIEPLLQGTRARLSREDVGQRGGHAANLVLDMPGRSDANVVVVGAHYDTAPGTSGANDNASGVAVLLELARRFRQRVLAHPLRFVFFANEEPPYFQRPGMGSLVHAAKAHKRGDHIKAMLSLETLGYYTDKPGTQAYPWPLSLAYPSTGNFVAFVGNWRSRSLVRQAIERLRATTAFPSEGAALPEIVPGVGWSDHWSFWQYGYPAIMITDTAVYRDPSYHEASDRPANIDYLRLARLVSGVAHVVERLASDDD
jgi:ADP-ribosylglycohydrolase